MLKPTDEITITVRRAIGDRALAVEMTLSGGVVGAAIAPELMVFSAVERLSEGLNEAENREAAYG